MNSPNVEPDTRASSRSIWVFTPSRTPPEDLEAILVQRHDLLQDAVERIRESALTEHKHHLLFVGPRGCGKTHLVTLIVCRIGADAEAAQHLRLAWLNEDETCTSLLELLIKIHTALQKRYPEEFRAEDLAEAYERKQAAALDLVSERLLASLDGKALVVVTENLDALFESMGEQGQKQLRAFIQEHPRFAIVGTAQRLVEDLSDRTSPFFGFFQTEHLKPLNEDQAATLLQNIARLQGKHEVTAFLATSRGRSRVRALHHLSGGNHRIYIVLSQFITQDSLDTLIGPFMKMVDELTPYYQERLRWLPPLQRKIVEFLCACEGTVPVKEIARRLFSTPQTISSQLQGLREKGYVEANQRGREFLYEISEPLMRICVEVKENQNTQPLRLLVDFLRVWYDDIDLKRRLGLCQPESYSHQYLSAAVRRNDLEGSLRMRILAEELLGGDFTNIDSDGWKQLESEGAEDVLLAIQCLEDGDIEGALICVNRALVTATTPTVISRVLFVQGVLHSEQGDSTAAIADYTRVLGFPEAASELMAEAFFRRGVCHGRLDNNSLAMADFTRVTELPGASPEQIANALLNRGFAHGRQGDSMAELADYSRVIGLPEAPTEQVAIAFLMRGITRRQRGDSVAAIADYTRVIELAGAPCEQVARALLLRGIAYRQKGDSAAAIGDYTRVVAQHGAQPEQVVSALLNRGATLALEGDRIGAIADYTQVIKVPGALPEQVAKALVKRGIEHEEQGDSVVAIADYNRVVALPGAPPEEITWALSCRARCQFLAGDKNASRESLEAVISLAEAPSEHVINAHFALVGLHFGDGRWSEGFRALDSALNLGAQQSPSQFASPTDLIGVLFSAGLSQEGRRDYASRIHTVHAKHGALPVLGEALVKHLGTLCLSTPRPASDNLDQWLAAWKQAAGDSPEFRLPLRLLRTGIEFPKSEDKDEGILLSLTATERSILRQALGLDTSDE